MRTGHVWGHCSTEALGIQGGTVGERVCVWGQVCDLSLRGALFAPKQSPRHIQGPSSPFPAQTVSPGRVQWHGANLNGAKNHLRLQAESPRAHRATNSPPKPCHPDRSKEPPRPPNHVILSEAKDLYCAHEPTPATPPPSSSPPASNFAKGCISLYNVTRTDPRLEPVPLRPGQCTAMPAVIV